MQSAFGSTINPPSVQDARVAQAAGQKAGAIREAEHPFRIEEILTSARIRQGQVEQAQTNRLDIAKYNRETRQDMQDQMISLRRDLAQNNLTGIRST